MKETVQCRRFSRFLARIGSSFIVLIGMSTVVNILPKIKDVSVTDESITAQLMDGRIISVPLEWSWRLTEATPEQRAHFEIIGDGHGVHWPDIDEDISAEGMLYGSPAPRPKRPARKPQHSKKQVYA